MSSEHTKIATQLRKRADAMEARIQAKLDPAIAHQNLTPRRMRIANSMRDDALRMQKHQAALRALAGAHESETGREDLRIRRMDKIRFATHVAMILNPYTKVDGPYGDGEKLKKLGITTQAILDGARIRLEALIEAQGTNGPSPEAEAIRAKEQALVGAKIPGFFPTPAPLIEEMLDIVAHVIDPSSARILEPSAGKGDIAEAIRERFPHAELDVGEINYELRELLELKGFHVRHQNFLERTPESHTDYYDAIIQNPPFENGLDIAHVLHAFDWLKPDGLLVSIVSEGPFFREDAASKIFRQWFEEKGAQTSDVEAGAFSKAFRSTGVKTRILVVTKRAVAQRESA